ncbi:MAG TPA: hypothetical protein VFR20_13450 [Burkholderiaceae bacterium]|nr:hypothetical protein [Burkholderiaceae bacterium]
MQIVLPGALPDPGEARELAAHLPKAAPTLACWLGQSQARIFSTDPAGVRCTPYEQWLLHTRGFTPRNDQPLCAGLGPMLANDGAPPDDEPIWLAELVHIAPSRDGAALLPARDLAIEPEQSVALFDAAQTLLPGSGFDMRRLGVEHWRVLPGDAASLPIAASPTLVSLTSVNDWWPQDAATRPWRRLVNELQMLWFDHPVNQERTRLGLPEINSLWVFGGASAKQFHSGRPAIESRTYPDLLEAHTRHDWSNWLAALGDLEARVFAPLANQRTTPDLVLTGRDRYVELRSSALGKLRNWLPGGRDTWRNWWSPRH